MIKCCKPICLVSICMHRYMRRYQQPMPTLTSGLFHPGWVCTGIVVHLQVYRGVLRKGGQPVAVKVQRPGVRESIALDIYILRWLAGKLCFLLQLTAVSLSGTCQLLCCNTSACSASAMRCNTNTDSGNSCQQQFIVLLLNKGSCL